MKEETKYEIEESWKDYPDLTAWEDAIDVPVFDWSLNYEKLEKKYLHKPAKSRDDFDPGWGNSFEMVKRNYHKEKNKKCVPVKKVAVRKAAIRVHKQVSEEVKAEVATKCPVFDIEPPKLTSHVSFINFHIDE